MPVRQRIPRLAEFIALFLVAPAALAWLAAGTELPVVPILVVIGALAALYLVRVAPDQLHAAVVRPWHPPELRRIGLQLLVGSVALAASAACVHPDRLLDLPRREPGTWVLILVLYPLLSVVPQELLFRAVFFQRYASLWSGSTAPILVSAAVFGLAHVIYGHWLSVGLATLGGLLFAWTFARTGSLFLVVVEHSAYGILLFTLGFGRYFQAGP
jgi:membrane protease YdiL (CAAX protease family)